MVCITLNVVPNRVISCIGALGDGSGILAVLGQAVNHRAACRFTYADEILRFADVGQRIGGRSCCDYRCCLSDGKVNAHGLAAQRNRSSISACVHGFAGKGFAVLGKGNGNIRIFQRAGLRNNELYSSSVIGLAGCTDSSGAGVSAVCAAGFGDGVAVCGIGQGVIFACCHITALVAGLLMGAVAVVGVGVGCTITMRLRVLGDGIMDVLHPVITQLGGDRVVPELFPGYTCDLYVVTPGFQIRIAVYSLKTVVTEVIAILDCSNTPKRAKCAKTSLVGQVCTTLKRTCKQAVFKGSLCICIGEAQETAHIDGCGVIIVACVIGLDGAVGAAVADGHFTGILLNLADKAARAGVHTVLACIKGAVPGALFDQALVVCVSHKAADHDDAVGLRGNIHEGGDILNDRAVAFKSVIGAVKTANRADDTANVVNLGVHDHLTVYSEVLDRTGSDLTEEANAVFGTFHVQTPDGVVLSVKDTAEVVVVLAGLADGCPGLVFEVDMRRESALDLSVALYIDLLCKPEELACVVNFVVALCV